MRKGHEEQVLCFQDSFNVIFSLVMAWSFNVEVELAGSGPGSAWTGRG